jgi:hypothetical protein
MPVSNPNQDALLKREKGKYFSIGPNFRGGRAGFVIQNLSKLPLNGNVLEPKRGTRGFPEYPEPPLLCLHRKLGRPLRDIELYHAYWLISASAKAVFTSLDPEGFAFLKCNVFTELGPGPEYWLCDIIRVLDAVDDENSSVKITHDSLGKWYSFVGRENLIFQHEVVGLAHIFRLSYHTLSAIFCDRRMKEACKSADLKGLRFGDATGL